MTEEAKNGVENALLKRKRKFRLFVVLYGFPHKTNSVLN
jgi:hypothetical protein